MAMIKLTFPIISSTLFTFRIKQVEIRYTHLHCCCSLCSSLVQSNISDIREGNTTMANFIANRKCVQLNMAAKSICRKWYVAYFREQIKTKGCALNTFHIIATFVTHGDKVDHVSSQGRSYWIMEIAMWPYFVTDGDFSRC